LLQQQSTLWSAAGGRDFGAERGVAGPFGGLQIPLGGLQFSLLGLDGRVQLGRQSQSVGQAQFRSQGNRRPKQDQASASDARPPQISKSHLSKKHFSMFLLVWYSNIIA
jgi:hypothetical protein